MEDAQVLASLEMDDAYEVLSVLADGPSGRTELVRMGGSETLVRKRVPLAIANVAAWTTLMGIDDELLVHVVSLYRLPDELVVVCAWVEGLSLGALIEAEGALVPRRAVAILEDVCHAASVLHAHGVIHRDVVPGNVVVDRKGHAHLIDLGIARVHTDGAAADTTNLGTWGFAAPEQFGFAQTDARSDVYALGRLLAYMLTGEEPGTVASDTTLSDASAVPPALAGVVAHASAFEPSARYQSADELARAARKALDADDALWSPVGSRAKPVYSHPSLEPATANVSSGEAAVRPRGRSGRLRRALAGALVLVVVVCMGPLAVRKVMYLRARAMSGQAVEGTSAFGVELSEAERALVTNPSEAYVLERLSQVDGISSPVAATKRTDPNGLLDEAGGYTAAVYFVSDLIARDADTDEDAISRGVGGGGSVEVYATAEDAVVRDAYLGMFDGGPLPAGAHLVCGTCVIRTSDSLSSQQQEELERAIIEALTAPE